MSCTKRADKISTLAGQIGAGISKLAGKRAFYVGAAATIGGAILALRAAQRRRLRALKFFPVGLSDYVGRGFDLGAGQTMTKAFGGTRLKLNSLTLALGPESQSWPFLKMGGEDDIFLMEGPNGHIYFSRPDDDVARIVTVIPKRGRAAEVSKILAKSSDQGGS